MKKNKWLIMISGMLIQLSIGSIYAYSKWIDPLKERLQWDPHDTKIAFSIAICFLGLTAAFAGNAVKKLGPTISGVIGAAFMFVGLFGTSFAIKSDSIVLFYLCYGAIQGIGLGLGYIVPVYTVAKWFPDKPGFASGMTIMSFALGSLLASFIIGPVIAQFGLAGAFTALSVIYGTCMLLFSAYLTNPADEQKATNKAADQYSEILKDKRFICLWLILFLNVCGGISIISKAALLGKEVAGMTTAQATFFVAIIGLFNGLGRLFWSSISDIIGCLKTYRIFLTINVLCFALIPSFASDKVFFQALTFVIIAGYGAGFATMPSFAKSIFGPEKYGQVFGFVLTAWSAAGFVGPMLIDLTPKIDIFYLFSVITLSALLVTYWLKAQLKQ